MKVYIGIDWSKEKLDAIFMNEAGQAILYCQLAHMQPGLLELGDARRKLGVEPIECIVGIETSYNLIIDALWNWGYDQVYVLPRVRSIAAGDDINRARPARIAVMPG